MNYRETRDSMGIVQVPKGAYYGAQTQRAVNNFSISDLHFHDAFLTAVGLIKSGAARVNRDLNLLDDKIAGAIIQAADEVVDGRFREQFVVDIFQTGSGTSTNMNMNEVIAGRANEILTGKIQSRSPVHPNDHVNMGQSSNDVIPSAIHIAAFLEIKKGLLPQMARLRDILEEKTQDFAPIRKIARTHLQDAVPISMGREFSGYAHQVRMAINGLTEPWGF